jgi:DNA-binding beta-propeller fold protein YncE
LRRFRHAEREDAMLLKARVTPCFVLAALFALSLGLGLRAQNPPAFANFEGAQTNPIRLSADKTLLFVVNTPNKSLAVFDVTTPGSPVLKYQIPVGVEPVSVNPRTNNEAWVVNEESDSVSVVSLSQKIVTDTIYAKDEPMDVVFAGTNQAQAYVSCSRNNVISVFDSNTHAPVSQLAVLGDNPRALAVSNDGTSTVYAAFALSGNATTIIPSNLAPPQPPPTNPALPPPPKAGLIVAATDPAWSSYIKFTMPANGVVAIQTGTPPSITGYYPGVGTVNLGLAVNPVTGDLFVANTDALNLTFYEPNLRGHWVNNRITRISSGQVMPPFDLNPNINYSILPNPAALATALAQPTAVVFDPGGTFMYVAAFGTDRVAKVDTNGNVLSFVEVALPSGSGSKVDPANKRGPRGLALNAAANTLYCLNRIANTISIIDTSKNVVSSEIQLTDPTPQAIKAGRGFLYDAKLSGSGTGACASCHVDGEMDKLAWNLGDPGGTMTSVVQNGQTIQFHPMKGPMTTQTLRGLLNQSPYHWRGDKPDFAAFNAAFDVLMGGNQLSDTDMTTYTNFVNTILYQPNPNRLLNNSFPSSLQGGIPANGQSDFINVALTTVKIGPSTCNSCHEVSPSGTGTNRLIDAVDFDQPLKNPHLRNVYQRLLYNLAGPTSVDGFGLDHDGKVPGITAFFHGSSFVNYSQQQKTDMTAFMLCFDTGTAPAVGYTRTLTQSNVSTTSAQKDWSTLQQQAGVGNIDLIARGTIKGQVHGLLYQPSSNNYILDTGAPGPFTQAQLQSFIQNGDILSFMGVYPGTGSTN